MKKTLATPHHVGTAKPLKLAADVKSSAIYGGPGNCYRYRLLRTWNPGKPRMLWLMMNPSVATEDGDDRTVAKCQRYARKWGFGGMYAGNSFAYRCTDQKRLAEISDPIGPENWRHIEEMARNSNLIVLAFGTPQIKSLHEAGDELAEKLRRAGFKLHALKVGKTGRPMHPLYLSESLTPVPYEDG